MVMVPFVTGAMHMPCTCHAIHMHMLQGGGATLVTHASVVMSPA